ncbi:Os02g0173401 [Oryza sativa Japonica Group]|uniref:Os02g0173401 protein n=1 Tax=Oryza sativa subsp. japonica TaxID=39947 RepID=A0A0P0VFI9_ORYSJ|nr:Os02g0173401 [Oryza sativa Japonica Group]
MELGLLLAPSPGAPTSMAGRTVRNSIDATGGGGGTLRQGALVPLGRSRSPASSAPSPPPPALNVSRQITGTLTNLTLRAIMGECGFRWREEFLKTLGEAQKKVTWFGVVGSRS